MRGTFSSDISSASTQQIHSKNSCILLGRISTKGVQRIVKFKIFTFFFFVNMGPDGSKNFKWCVLSKYKTNSIPKIHAYY